MPPPRRCAPGALLLIWLALPGTALAQVDGGGPAAAPPPIPACTPAREGAVSCLSGKLCACRFDAGGSLTGRPAGYRWDCGVLRPDCGVVPPTVGGPSASDMLRDLPPLLVQPPLWPGGAAPPMPPYR